MYPFMLITVLIINELKYITFLLSLCKQSSWQHLYCNIVMIEIPQSVHRKYIFFKSEVDYKKYSPWCYVHHGI